MPTMPEFSNNLRAGDQVLDTETKRRGLVDRNPRGRSTSIIFDGTKTSKYIDVMQLRLIPKGAKEPIEDVPPITGEPPPLEAPPPRRPITLPEARAIVSRPAADPIATIAARRDQIKAEMADLEARFKALREEDNRLEAAMVALKA